VNLALCVVKIAGGANKICPAVYDFNKLTAIKVYVLHRKITAVVMRDFTVTVFAIAALTQLGFASAQGKIVYYKPL
jgi:hypothetical protein